MKVASICAASLDAALVKAVRAAKLPVITDLSVYPDREDVLHRQFELLVERIRDAAVEAIADLVGKHEQFVVRRHHCEVAVEGDRWLKAPGQNPTRTAGQI